MDERETFEKRLRTARDRQGLDQPETSKAALPSAWGFGLRAGVEIVSALVVGVGLGLMLDRWLGTWPWLFLLMFCLGAAAGVLNIYRLVNPRPGARRD